MRHVFAAFVFSLATLAAACSYVPTETPESGAMLTPVELSRTAVTPMQAGDSYYQSAAAAVAARAEGRKVGGAKNIILFVGDGMGISTITAARIYAGQKRGQDGESYRLAMETLPYMALSKTYSHDSQVSDSASTATAMVAGIKSRSRTLGVTKETAFSNCASAEGNGTDSLFELAEREGLSTGIVSTARITHATPAATYAESASRDWEDDTSVRGDCLDIASQLVAWPEGDGFEVAMGGGRRHFLSKEMGDPEDGTGARGDGRDLASEWAAKSDDHIAIVNQNGFDTTDFDSDVKVLGLFEPSHMNYELDRAEDAGGEPSLEALTRAAITRLSRNEDGYLLMVEGGRIDHGHHAGNAIRALEDTDAFDNAVAAALDMTSANDTLVIVTADHSHTLTLAGYPQRNNPILGKVVYPGGTPAMGGDGKPYTSLGYANGPGAACPPDGPIPCPRGDLTDVDTTAKDFRQQALVPMGSETHAGEDVAVFARGPGAALIAGVIEQNEIFHVMGHASGLVE